MSKHVLITGGAGFVGSNIAVFLKKRLGDHTITCLDNLVRPGSGINAQRIQDAGINFIKEDIRNRDKLLELPKIDYIIECSAEPSVLAAFDDPHYTIDTNLIGTINCLELARRDKAGFLFLSSSRVYPIEGLNSIPYEENEKRFEWTKEEGAGYSFDGINENFPLDGVRSLYGASKLSSEHLITEFIDMFGIKAVINRLGIVAGPWQMGKIDQGLIGYWVARHIFDGQLKYFGYRGSGKQVRDAVHVDDLCELLYHELLHLDVLNGKVFNAGGGRQNSFSLLELSEKVAESTGKKMDIEPVPEERRADVRSYITDNAYVYRETGWKPQKGLEEIIADTARWIEEHKTELEKVLG